MVVTLRKLNFWRFYHAQKKFILFFEFVWTIICVMLEKIFDLICFGSIFKFFKKIISSWWEEQWHKAPLLLDFEFMMSKYAHEISNSKFWLWLCSKLKFEGNQFVCGLTITIFNFLKSSKIEKLYYSPPRFDSNCVMN
jgi:hypothetical protein